MKLRLALLATALALTTTASAQAAYPSSIASTRATRSRAPSTTAGSRTSTAPRPPGRPARRSYSHYRRIQAVNPAITGRTYNHAVTGADMADLAGQVQGRRQPRRAVRDDPDGRQRRLRVERSRDDPGDACSATSSRGRWGSDGGPSERPRLRLQHPRHLPALLALPLRPRRERRLGDRRDLPVDAGLSVRRIFRATLRAARASGSETSTTTPCLPRSVPGTRAAVSTRTRSSTPPSCAAT